MDDLKPTLDELNISTWQGKRMRLFTFGDHKFMENDLTPFDESISKEKAALSGKKICLKNTVGDGKKLFRCKRKKFM